MADKKYIGEPGKQDDPCWKGYEMVGMKKKGGRKVPNCVPEATDIIAKAKAAVAKKAGAKLKMDPDTGTPDHFTAAQRRKKGLDEGVTNPEIKKAYADLIKTPGGSSERKSAIRRYKSLRQNAVKEEVNIDKYADMLIKRDKQNLSKSHVVHAARVAGVDHKKLMSAVNQKVGRIKEETEHNDCGTPECCGQCDTAIEEQSSDTFPWHEDPKNPTRKVGERKDQYGNKVKNVARYLAKKAMKANEEVEISEENHYTVVKGKQGWSVNQHTPNGVWHHSQQTGYHDSKSKAVSWAKNHAGNREHKIDVKEEVESIDEYNNYRKAGKDPFAARKQYIAMDRAEKKGVMPGSSTSTADAIAAFKAKGGKITKLDTMGNMKEGMMPTSDEPTAANKKTADKVRAMMSKEKKQVKEELGKVYSVHVKGDSKDHNSPEFKKHLKGWGGELHYASDKGAAYKFKKEYQATGFHHGVKSGFKSLDSEHDGQVKEELGKDNEWGRPELRKKFAAMTPGQESMAADKIPTFDPRYDDVPTKS
jgi:bacterioferritin-associated ferredoxin